MSAFWEPDERVKMAHTTLKNKTWALNERLKTFFESAKCARYTQSQQVGRSVFCCCGRNGPSRGPATPF